nr:hypothetical protein [Tanacetum cinerariifolium]
MHRGTEQTSYTPFPLNLETRPSVVPVRLWSSCRFGFSSSFHMYLIFWKQKMLQLFPIPNMSQSVYILEVGCPGATWSMAGEGGGAPFDVGFFAGNENADPTDMGTAEQHQNISRREWHELHSSREWISVENHFARISLCKAKQRGLKASRWWQDGVLNKVLLLPSLTSKGNGVKLNASLVHSERISALAEVEKGEEGTSRLREEALREQGASLPLSERPIEREAVNQLSGLGLLVSEGCFRKAYERLSFDGRSVAGWEELIPGVKDGSSSSSALLAASSQLSSKRWFARAIVRISSTMSTESSTRNHFFDILEKIKQFRVSKLMVIIMGSSPKCIKTLGSTIPRPSLGCVKPRADTNKSVPLIPPNTEPSIGRPVPTSKIVSPWKARELLMEEESPGCSLSSLERIDRQAAINVVTIEEIRKRELATPSIYQQSQSKSDRFLVVVGTALVHFSMQGRPSGRIKGFLLCKAINALVKIFSSRSFIFSLETWLQFNHSLWLLR